MDEDHVNENAVVPADNNPYGDLTIEELRNIPVPRIMVQHGDGICRLDESFSDLMKCSKCKRVPMYKIYQCLNGHIICAACFMINAENDLVPDDAANDYDRRQYRCPTCFVSLDVNDPIRNLLAECIIKSVEAVCQQCGDTVISSRLREHCISTCRRSLVTCTHWRRGCKWIGAMSDAEVHESTCASANNSAGEIAEALCEREARSKVKLEQYARVRRLLENRFLIISNLRVLLFAQGTGINEFLTMDQFFAHNSWWNVLLMRQDEGNVSSIVFKLQIQAAPRKPKKVSYCLINSSHSQVKIDPNGCEKVVFDTTNLEGPERVIYRNTKEATEDLMYERGLYLRVFIGLHMKFISN